MFATEIRRAVMAAPRSRLSELSAAVWKGYAAGVVAEDDAQQLAELIEARKLVPASPPAPRRSVGSRPRTDASMERRRRWTGSGWLPPQLAARFTMAECAVLAVVADQVSRRGNCMLTIGAIAAQAGFCRSTVKTAMREARAAGLITIEEWRISAWRNAPNTVKIISPEWSIWLRMRAKSANARNPVAAVRGGVKSVTTTNTQIFQPTSNRPQSLKKKPDKTEGFGQTRQFLAHDESKH